MIIEFKKIGFKNRPVHHYLPLLVAGLLSACGGAGGDASSDTSGDTTAPIAPTVTSLTTEDTTPTITGTFDASDYAGGFAVKVNGVTYTLGTDAALTNSGNSWSLTIPAGSALALGSYDVIAAAADADGNAASDTTTNELTIQAIPPTVAGVTPLNDATGVARSASVTATFDEDIFAASVDSASFTLAANSNDSGTVSFDGATNIATFTPDNGLALAANYTATLTTGITDLYGNGLTSDYSWSFTTADGSWGTAEVAENDATNNFDNPSVVLEDNGDAIVVWSSYSPSSDIWANRYTAGSGWGTPELIENNANSVTYPHIAGDGNGNAIAVWRQSDGTKLSIWANRYVAGSGWGTAELIETDDAGDAIYPTIAFDGSGNATAVWPQSDGTRVNTVANRYTAGSGWGSAQIIDSEDLGDASETWITASDNGDAIAVWRQSDGVRNNAWANRYDAASGHWEGAVKIESLDGGNTYSPRIAMDSSGNATAVFNYAEGPGSSWIYANRYVAGSGWSGAVAIDDNTGTAASPWVTLDDNGNAMVIWQDNGNSIGANRYTAGSGWGTPELIDNHTGGLAETTSQVTSDAQGNAIAIWIQDDGTLYSAWANRYVAGSGWKGAERIESDDTNNVDNFGVSSLATNGRGQAMAVWRQVDGAKDSIWVNRFE